MAIDFPNSPTNNDVYTVGNRSWVYSSSLGAWSLQSSLLLGANTVTTTEIANGAVTQDKLSPDLSEWVMIHNAVPITAGVLFQDFAVSPYREYHIYIEGLKHQYTTPGSTGTFISGLDILPIPSSTRYYDTISDRDGYGVFISEEGVITNTATFLVLFVYLSFTSAAPVYSVGNIQGGYSHITITNGNDGVKTLDARSYHYLDFTSQDGVLVVTSEKGISKNSSDTITGFRILKSGGSGGNSTFAGGLVSIWGRN